MAASDDFDIKNITCKLCSDVYTDARDLACGHTFCLSCLHYEQPEECPECKEKDIPTVGELDKLPCNETKNNLVRLEILRRIKNSVTSPENEGGQNMRHEGVTCSQCDKKDFTGVRYICGVCPSYNLCQACQQKPKEHKHDRTHIFLKVKRALNENMPTGPLLHEVGITMGKAMDLERTTHRVLEKVGETTYRVVAESSCDRCAKAKGPIIGVCYSCGYCPNYMICGECEKRSDIIHDPSHIFLVVNHPTKTRVEGEMDTKLIKYSLQ